MEDKKNIEEPGDIVENSKLFSLLIVQDLFDFQDVALLKFFSIDSTLLQQVQISGEKIENAHHRARR